MYVIIFFAGNVALRLARLSFSNYANLVSAHASDAMQQLSDCKQKCHCIYYAGVWTFIFIPLRSCISM